jgi:outer membrane protein TolC
VIPIGQFSPLPTDETRPIQFGTDWQQNAGITLYQPLMDLSLKNRIKEAGLNEKLSSAVLRKLENDLIFEIIKTYSRIVSLNYESQARIADTIRSFQSYTIIEKKWKEGKVLKTDLNNALVNHYNNVSGYRTSVTITVNEKIYLQFLTGIDLDRLLKNEWLPIPESIHLSNTRDTSLKLEEMPEYQALHFKEKILRQQIKTEKNKYTPTLGLEAFIGANQFSNSFDPFLENSWYGSSYVGLALRLPIFSPDRAVNGGKQIMQQIEIVGFQKDGLKSEKNKEMLQLANEIRKMKDEVSSLQNSLELVKENILIYQNRLRDGQLAAIDLNIQETEVQKISNQINKLREELILTQVEQLHVSGRLNTKTILSMLKP